MAEGELKVDHNPESAVSQPAPGQVIAPGAATPAPAEKAATVSPEVQPEQPAPASTQAETPQPAPPAPPIAPVPPVASQAKPPASAPPAETQQPAPFATNDQAPPEIENRASDAIDWTASEFIAHEKSAGWYLGIALAGAAIAGLVFFITRDYISAVVVLVGAFSLGVLGAKKPKQQHYGLDNSGLTIGQKHYDYHAFKSFAVVPEGAFASIVFMPLKRFAPLTTIYYPPEEEDRIANLLSKHLPLETHKLDAVDHLMQRIRF